MSELRRRETDSGWRYLVKVLYRDVWLLTISVVVVVAVWQSVDTASQARDTARAVQENRLESIRSACEQLNARHDNTIATLDRVISLLPVAKRSEAEASKRFTVELIDTLDPKRDCAALVRAAELPR